MHSPTQILAQRAPPAIRTKPRWQPYHSMNPSNTPLTLRSPTVTLHANTPVCAVPSSSDCSPSEPSASELLNAKVPPTPIPQTPKDPSHRDVSKHKFAAGLIDQAVNILSEIWRPQDVPDVFKAPTKGSSLGSALGQALPLSAHTSLPNITSASHILHRHPSFLQPTLPSVTEAENNLLPMKTFVHEVLKRSRTSGSILQAALCYLEAIRPKVPEILQQEKMGIRAHYQPETKILPATEAELAREAELAALEDTFNAATEIIGKPDCDQLKTVRVTDVENDDLDSMQHSLDMQDSASISSLVVESSAPVETTRSTRSPSLPSPLLCPRRAFLASLILASKFFQDKCYSNRAWAKLSGLPPREIGRCERALGQALEWRLWVGKSSIQTLSPPRPLVRSQSDSHGLCSSNTTSHNASKSLRKCSTLPLESYGQPEVLPTSNIVFDITSQSRIASLAETQREDLTPISTITTALNCPQPQCIEKGTSAPSPDTPGLTYSPSSTDSSGDRTIQMSTFEDGMFPNFSSQPWFDALAAAQAGGVFNMPSKSKYSTTFDSSLISKPTIAAAARISIVDSDLGSYGSHCMWHADNRCISLETTDVH